MDAGADQLMDDLLEHPNAEVRRFAAHQASVAETSGVPWMRDYPWICE